MDRALTPFSSLKKTGVFLSGSGVSGIPPIASIFASNSSLRGKTPSIGIRTGSILPERFEIAMCVRFQVVDGMLKYCAQTVRWNDDFCNGILFFIKNILLRIAMRFVLTGSAEIVFRGI